MSKKNYLDKRRYQLIEVVKYKKERQDPLKKQKDILTDFVNKTFLKYNKNELRLLQAVYKSINPFLDQLGLKLVFKGGNVMRLINNNLKEYFYPLPNEIIFDIFEPYLLQSDNDFTIFINPNLEKYEAIIKNVTHKIYEILDDIRNDFVLAPSDYFNFFQLNTNIREKILRKLSVAIEANDIRLHPIYDKKIVLENENRPKSDIQVYNDRFHKESYIFNLINLSLEFTNPKNELIKFYLVRSKVNFLLNDTRNIAGELIDISLPHKKDSEMKKLDSSVKFQQFLKNSIIESYNTEYDFKYYMVNINYIIKDLYRIIFKQYNFPWEISKYKKRLARLIYFIFIDYLNEYNISIKTLDEIKYDFLTFTNQIRDLNTKLVNTNGYLQGLFIATLELTKNNPNRDEMTKYILTVLEYSKAILRICDNLIEYLEGKIKISEKKLYELDVV